MPIIELAPDLPDDCPDDWLTQRMRDQRNRLLRLSDWTQLADSSVAAVGAWATYRQQLRDFPASWTPADTADFPDPPEEAAT